MIFDDAMKVLRNNDSSAIRLKSWETDRRVRMMKPKYGSEMTYPYLYIESRFGRSTWKASPIEIYEKNWEIIYID